MSDSKTIKAELKTLYPDVKFSVKTRKSLDTFFIVEYTNGPSEREIIQLLNSHKIMPIIDRTVTK